MSGEKDVVVLDFRAERPGCRIIIPLLNEKDAGFGAGVRLESIWVKADNREDRNRCVRQDMDVCRAQVEIVVVLVVVMMLVVALRIFVMIVVFVS